MRLSVIVPAADGPATLPRCLAAIGASSLAPDELIVVEEPSGLNAGAARNRGVAVASGEILVFVDADVVVAPDAIERLAAELADDPSLVAVFGAYDDRVETSFVGGFRNLLHHETHRRSAGETGTFWAGLGAVRRSAFREAGGFDEAWETMEDVELGGRLAARGRVVLDPSITGTHLKDWTVRTMVATDFRGRGIPWVRLIAARRSAPRTLNLGLRERASAVAAVVVAAGALSRRPRTLAGGGAALLTLNARFYRLLHRRLGPAGAAAGVVLHTVHLLTCVAAVPVGIAQHLADVTRLRQPPPGRPAPPAADPRSEAG